MVDIISPVDGSIYATRPISSDAEIEAALSSARDARVAWGQTSIAARAKICTAAIDALMAMSEEIIPELAWQMGRPVKFGQGELAGTNERATAMIAMAEAALAPIVPPNKPGFTREIHRVPLGTVLVVAPWNYPYLTAVNTIVPALMAGNAVILKHASQTLLAGERFQQAFDQAGLPAGLFRNLVLSHEQTAKIIASGLIDQVNFTGSVPGGRSMEAAASGHFIGVGLELGGKDPAFVRADAQLEATVENLVDGAFFNSGQSCCGIERIYVDAAIYDRFVEGFVALTRDYVLGDPLDAATTIGPMVNAKAADFVRDQISAATRAGATCHIDTSAFARDAAGSAYMAPQVLTGVNHQMGIMIEESFGPVIGIMKVASDDEAVALMNDSPFGLTASIWTGDLEAATELAEKIETGTVFMNRCDYLDPELTWTGVKNTGRGATLSQVGYEALTRPKSFHLRHMLET
ncbi:MAG: aldehyde dehydrogenase family protein [Alphaproteobacteria bacterium]